MTKDEALRLALEALKQIDEAMPFPVAKLAQKVIKEALAQPELEPCCYGGIAHDCHAGEGCRIVNRMKATPPQRTWVGLTDKEIEAIWKIAMFADYGIGAELSNQPFVHYARAIEAKLKEKNNG